MTAATEQTEQDSAMQTVAEGAGINPQREVIATQLYITDCDASWRATKEYLQATGRGYPENPTFNQKMEWAYVVADQIIKYGREHPPK